MKPVRLGIIGTGIAARDLHWPALRKMREQFEIVALCNRTRSKAEAFADLVGGSPRITTEYGDLLSSPDVDAVDISLPIALNAPVAIDALRAGKHVFLEKPIAGDLQGGREVVDEAKRHPDLVLLVAENVRYEERFRRARSLIEEGAIGRPVMVHGEVLAPINPTSPYSATAWRQHPEHLGGYLSDGGVHQVAALQMLGGQVDAVSGIVTAFHPEADPNDTLVATTRFASGAVGTLLYSVGVDRWEPSQFRVFGTGGVLSVSETTITMRTDKGEQEIDLSDAPSGYRAEFEEFYEAVRNGRPPFVTPADALRDLAVIDAVFRSSASGETVTV